MFRLTPNPTFTAKVFLSVPGAEKAQPVPFTFKHKGRTAMVEWLATSPGTPDADVLDKVITDWGVVDGDGQPVKYSRDALAELLENYPAARFEIFNAYVDELSKAKAKNS